MKRKTPEGYVKHAVLDYLAACRIYALRVNSGAQVIVNPAGVRRVIQSAPAGTADILASPRIRDHAVFLWIETKAKGGKLSESQITFRCEREADGHYYLLAFSVDDVEEWMRVHAA